MPFRATEQFIPNTLYNFMPPSRWEGEEWNRYIKTCDKFGDEYCFKINKDEPFTMQFRPRFIGSNLAKTGFLYSNAITTTTAGKATAPNIGVGTAVDQLIFNLDTQQSTYITAIDSTNVVSVADDIFTASDAVLVYDYKSQQFSVGLDQDLGILFCNDGNAGTLTLPNVVINANYFYVSVFVTDYAGGELDVKLGTQVIGTITANGTHEFFGTANGVNLVFDTTDFIGCLKLAHFECYGVKEDYFLATYDKDFNFVSTEAIRRTFYNGVLSFEVGPFEECSCQYFAIEQESPCMNDESIIDGTFTTSTPWDFPDPGTVNIKSGELEFKMAAEGDYCEYIGELTCPILCDTEYDIKFEVTSHISGNIVFNVGGTSLGVTITGTGNYSFPLTTGTDCTDVIQIISGSANATFNIDNVSINYKNDVYDTLGISELACICTVDGCDSTITFSNDVDSFGYAYDEGEITNQLIVCGRLRNSVMQFNELVNNKDTFGNQSIIYANLDNTDEFITEWIPPYMAKALTVALSHSAVTINGTAYILRSTFTAQVSDDSEYVKVLATVQKADQTYTFLYRK
jgi:hypothetical protein